MTRDYKPQSYGSVIDRVNSAIDYLGNYANDMFSAVSDLVFGPPIELAPAYDEKMVFDDYARRLGGGVDLKDSYGGLERGLGSKFNFSHSHGDAKSGHKGRTRFQRTDKKSTGKKVGVGTDKGKGKK